MINGADLIKICSLHCQTEFLKLIYAVKEFKFE